MLASAVSSASTPGSTASSDKPDGDDHPARGLCRNVRADNRRSAAARGYRTRHPDRERSHDLWRGGQIRRRQGHPRRHGAGAGDPRRRRRRHRHHQCRDPRLLGRRQSRYRHPRRPHQRDRQSRQPRYPARRGHRDRPRDRSDRRRGPHHHRRRHQLAHPFHLPAAGRRGALQRHHDNARGRHRAPLPAPRRRPARRAHGIWAGYCKQRKGCRSISASSAKAMLRIRARSSRWSRPAPAD